MCLLSTYFLPCVDFVFIYIYIYIYIYILTNFLFYNYSEVKDRLKKMRDDKKKTQSSQRGGQQKVAQKGRGKR